MTDPEGITAPRPWHKEPLVWMLIAIPLSAVLMAAVMIPLAVITSDGLVADDYYREGLRINRVLERDEQATKAGIELSQLQANDGSVSFQLDANESEQLPERLVISFTHATRADRDQDVPVIQVAPGQYRGETSELDSGNWNVVLGTETWRVTSRIRIP